MELRDLYRIWWLFFVIAFAISASLIYAWKKKTIKSFSDFHLIQNVFPAYSFSNYWLKTGLIFGALILIIFSMLNPLYGTKEQTIKKEGIDLIFALDVSSSMNAEDIAPSRLEKSKKIIRETLQKMGSDRVGLVIFAGVAYKSSPLTNDFYAIETYLSSISTDLIFQQGTNTAEAITQSVNLLKPTQNRAKAIVLISDGENHEANLEEAIDFANENNVQIITVGIGTKKGSPIPVKELGTTMEFKKDFYGEVVISKLEENHLVEIAKKTDSQYILAKQANETAVQILDEISTLEKTQYGEVKTQQKQPIFQWFLVMAILLIFIDSLTTEQKQFN